MVEIVTGADDLPVADTEHEDGRECEGFAGVGDAPPVFELGDDDLRIGRVVDGDVGGPAV